MFGINTRRQLADIVPDRAHLRTMVEAVRSSLFYTNVTQMTVGKICRALSESYVKEIVRAKLITR